MHCFKCERQMNEQELFDVNLFHHFKTTFHYGSEHDMQEWSFTLCEPCLLNFTDRFKQKPKTREYTFDEELGLDVEYANRFGSSTDFDGDKLAAIQDNSSSTESIDELFDSSRKFIKLYDEDKKED